MTLISLNFIVHSLLDAHYFRDWNSACLGFLRCWCCTASWLVLTDGVKVLARVRCFQASVHLKLLYFNSFLVYYWWIQGTLSMQGYPRSRMSFWGNYNEIFIDFITELNCNSVLASRVRSNMILTIMELLVRSPKPLPDLSSIVDWLIN